MRRLYCTFVSLLALAVSTLVCASPIVFSVGGNTTLASIQATVDAFRSALGDPNNANAAGLASGRREINWDGGGSTATSPGGNPFNVFLNTRGSQFTTPGTDLVQAPEDGGLNGGFATLFGQPSYGATFNPFSPTRLFGPIGSNVVDARFFIPGTNGGTAAGVAGFGAVFTDVDLPGSASLSFFDTANRLLGSQVFNVPTGTVADGSLSFLGVFFNGGEQIARVHIVSGNQPLGPLDNPVGGIDLVLMDDVLYREPSLLQAIPEPSTWALLGIAGLALLASRRRPRLLTA